MISTLRAWRCRNPISAPVQCRARCSQLSSHHAYLPGAFLCVPVLHLKRLKLELWRDESSSPFLRAEVRRITADVMVYDDASGSLDLQVTLLLGRHCFAPVSIRSDNIIGGVADRNGAMLIGAMLIGAMLMAPSFCLSKQCRVALATLL